MSIQPPNAGQQTNCSHWKLDGQNEACPHIEPVGQYICKVRLAQCLLNGQWLQYQYGTTNWLIQQWPHPNQIGQLSIHLWSYATPGWPMGYPFVVPCNTGWPINYCPHPNQVGQGGSHFWSHATPVGQWGTYFVVPCNTQPVGCCMRPQINTPLANRCCMGPQINTLVVPYSTSWPIKQCPHLNQIGQKRYQIAYATPVWLILQCPHLNQIGQRSTKSSS